MAHCKTILAIGFLLALAGVTVAQETKAFDINTLVDDFIEVSKVINGGINKLLGEVTPPLQDIVSQLPVNTQDFFNSMLIPLNDFLLAVVAKVDEINARAEQAHTDLLPIEPCIMNEAAGIESSFDGLFNGLLECGTTSLNNHADFVNEVIVTLNSSLASGAAIFDTLIPQIMTCLQPGTVDAKACFDPVANQLLASIVTLISDLAVLAKDLAAAFAIGGNEIFTCAAPAITDFDAAYDVWSQSISDCITTV